MFHDGVNGRGAKRDSLGAPGVARAGNVGGGGGSRAPRGGVTLPPNHKCSACAILYSGGCHLDLGRHHHDSGLNEPHWEHLGWPGWVTCVAGKGHQPPGVGSHDRRTGSGSASTILDRGGLHLGSGRRYPCWGLNELHWKHLGCPGLVTWAAGRVTRLLGRGHVTAGPEVARPAASLIAAGTILPRSGAILARSLMSLIRSTWGIQGGSRGQWGRVMCPAQQGHVTTKPEVSEAQGIANAKVLRQEHAWYLQGIARGPVWLERNERWRPVGDELRKQQGSRS